MTVQCCKCKCIRHTDGWVAPGDERFDAVSSTYCPECLATSVREMRHERALLDGLAAVG